MPGNIARLVLVVVWNLAALPAAAADGPWSLSTRDTQIGFAVSGGRPVFSALRSVAGGGNWAAGQPEAALPPKVTLGGKTLAVAWTYTGAVSGARRIEFKYRSRKPALTLLSRWESAPLPGPVEHTVLLTSGDTRHITLNLPPTTVLRLAAEPAHSYFHWWVEKAAGDVAPAGPNVDLITGAYSRSLVCGPYSTDMENRDEVPWLCIQDTTGSAVLYGGIEHSGWTEIAVSKGPSRIDITLGLQPRHYNTVTATPLPAGATLTYPPTFVGVCRGDVDDACNQLHRWIQKHLRPPTPGDLYYDPATGNGVLMIFRPHSGTASNTVRLRGLDPKQDYVVESADGSVPKQTASGSSLLTPGIKVALPGECSSDLVFFTAASPARSNCTKELAHEK